MLYKYLQYNMIYIIIFEQDIFDKQEHHLQTTSTRQQVSWYKFITPDVLLQIHVENNTKCNALNYSLYII